MLKLKVIGTGAAGNKAAIALHEAGFKTECITLINSTTKDIPEEYVSNSLIFGNDFLSLGGCGKERDRGKKLILQDLKSGKINLDSIADPDVNAVVIVTSTEGGSGSATTPIIAKYVKEVLGIPVIVCLLFGFNTDVRGMQNSIEICQELTEDYGVIGICNHKFLEEANGNKIKAEALANGEFINIIKILTGREMVPSSQNIDDTDLFKLVTTPGYMCVERANITKIKNAEQCNKIVRHTIDNSKSMDRSVKGAKRIGCIYNIGHNTSDYINELDDILISEYGVPYEHYTHVQESDGDETVTWIVAGMPMPIEEVKSIYESYMASSKAVNKNKDSFFDEISELRGNQEDGMFNMLSDSQNKTKSKNNFFADFGIESKTTTKNSNSKQEY